MSCYMRHMRWLFEALDLEYDKPNRKTVDAAVRGVLGMSDQAACPEVWAAIKGMDDDARLGLAPAVAERLSSSAG